MTVKVTYQGLWVFFTFIFASIYFYFTSFHCIPSPFLSNSTRQRFLPSSTFWESHRSSQVSFLFPLGSAFIFITHRTLPIVSFFMLVGLHPISLKWHLHSSNVHPAQAVSVPMRPPVNRETCSVLTTTKQRYGDRTHCK